MALGLRYQTAEAFAARYWDRVQNAYVARRKDEYSRLIYWLIEKINSGDITDAQARVSFNTAFGRTLNATQWTTLKTNRLLPAHDRWAGILAEGEL